MYRGFIAALSGEYRASARPGLAHRTSLKVSCATSVICLFVKEAAQKEFVSQSDICRRAVIADMRERGLLPEKGI
jgi:hypothetical protein